MHFQIYPRLTSAFQRQFTENYNYSYSFLNLFQCSWRELNILSNLISSLTLSVQYTTCHLIGLHAQYCYSLVSTFLAVFKLIRQMITCTVVRSWDLIFCQYSIVQRMTWESWTKYNFAPETNPRPEQWVEFFYVSQHSLSFL